MSTLKIDERIAVHTEKLNSMNKDYGIYWGVDGRIHELGWVKEQIESSGVVE